MYYEVYALPFVPTLTANHNSHVCLDLPTVHIHWTFCQMHHVQTCLQFTHTGPSAKCTMYRPAYSSRTLDLLPNAPCIDLLTDLTGCTWANMACLDSEQATQASQICYQSMSRLQTYLQFTRAIIVAKIACLGIPSVHKSWPCCQKQHVQAPLQFIRAGLDAKNIMSRSACSS